MDQISIAESDIQDAKTLVELHTLRLKNLQKLYDIEEKIKNLESNRSEWVKICSGTEEKIVKKQIGKHKTLSKIINEILLTHPDGISLEEITKLSLERSTKTSKNFVSTCRQYIYNMKKNRVINRDEATFKYFLNKNTNDEMQNTNDEIQQ
jgi:UDP-N-acetyl-D-mannosaminuronic acid transferase (WecB/TagA/CpsF family)